MTALLHKIRIPGGLSASHHRVPVVRVAIAFILGIINSEYLEANQFYIGLLFLFAGVGLLSTVLYGVRTAIPLAVSVSCFMFAGWYSAEKSKIIYSKQIFEGRCTLFGTVHSSVVEKQNTYKCLLDVLAVEGQASSPRFLSVAYFKKNNSPISLRKGDTVVCRAFVKEIQNMTGHFDYKKHMASRSVYLSVFVEKDAFALLRQKKNVFWQSIDDVRMKFKCAVADLRLSEETEGMVNSILLGDKSGLDAELKHDFKSAGAMHVLAVSGLHVGIVYFMLDYVLIFMTGFWLRKFKWGLIVLAVWCYACVSGMSDSVVRASIMFTCMAFSKILQRDYNVYNVLAVSCLITLSINPHSLFNVGFILSYSAVVGIVYVVPRMASFTHSGNRMLDWAVQLTVVSFSAQLMTLPICSYYWGEVALYGLLSNFIVIPLAMIVFSGGLISLLFNASGVGVFSVVVRVFDWLVASLCEGVAWCALLPNASVALKFSLQAMLIYYGILALLAWMIESGIFSAQNPVFRQRELLR